MPNPPADLHRESAEPLSPAAVDWLGCTDGCTANTRRSIPRAPGAWQHLPYGGGRTPESAGFREHVMGEQPVATFRITPWRPWLLAITPLPLIAAAGAVASLLTDQLATLAITALACAGLAAVLLLLVSAAVRVSRWHVDPNGIGGRNNSLVYRRLAWSEIRSVEPWPIPGYRYLQVRDIHGRRAFWLPLFLTDMPGLRSAVARYAPQGNPLREYLAQHPG